jgi:hypothetical protein
MTSDTARSFDLGPYQVTVQVFCGDAARFGSKADVCDATCNVRFAPNSDRGSGHESSELKILSGRVASAPIPESGACQGAGPVMAGRDHWFALSECCQTTQSSNVSQSNVLICAALLCRLGRRPFPDEGQEPRLPRHA